MGSSDDTTLWGSSSLLVQVTVVPAWTLSAGGVNEKLSIVTAEGATAGAAAAVSPWAWAPPVAAEAALAAWVGPPQAVRPTAANVAVAIARWARREKGRGIGVHLSGCREKPGSRLCPGRYGGGGPARDTGDDC